MSCLSHSAPGKVLVQHLSAGAAAGGAPSHDSVCSTSVRAWDVGLSGRELQRRAAKLKSGAQLGNFELFVHETNKWQQARRESTDFWIYRWRKGRVKQGGGRQTVSKCCCRSSFALCGWRGLRTACDDSLDLLEWVSLLSRNSC